LWRENICLSNAVTDGLVITNLLSMQLYDLQKWQGPAAAYEYGRRNIENLSKAMKVKKWVTL
jgi:hypothetical protein